ncbi:MAG: DUF3794 domain-containing protein [Eubacterium sp.]|nr:DUF3794 domain-containing protein [Eubacterium sp.]
MDIQKEFAALSRGCKVFSKTVDVEGDYQESLPAFLDDIYRVVKCTSHSFVTSADISFNELKVFGKTEICVTYYNENSCLCYADFEEEFTKSFTLDNVSQDAVIRACASDKYTSFRVINQRRIDIHNIVSLHISVYEKSECEYISSLENSRLKTVAIESADIVRTHIDKIDFDEELTLPQDAKPIGRIISAFAYPSNIETKIIKDKMLLKASVNANLLYSADGDGSIEKTQYSFAVSKIIEIGGIEDDDIPVIDVQSGALFFKVKGSSNDKMTLVNLFGDIAVNLTFVRRSSADIVTDGYLIGASSECTYTEVSVNGTGNAVDEVRSVSVPLEFNGDINDIKELSLSLLAPVIKNGAINQTVCANALISNEDGLSTLSADKDFEITLPDAEDGIVATGIEDYDFTLSDSGRVDLRLSLRISAYTFSNNNISLLSDITPGEELNNSHTLTVYFGKKNENLWDIAKSYSSDEAEIIKENSLNSSVLDTERILIIPKA